MKMPWWLIAAVAAGAILGAGLYTGQWDIVKGWAQILCTGCIGLY